MPYWYVTITLILINFDYRGFEYVGFDIITTYNNLNITFVAPFFGVILSQINEPLATMLLDDIMFMCQPYYDIIIAQRLIN